MTTEDTQLLALLDRIAAFGYAVDDSELSEPGEAHTELMLQITELDRRGWVVIRAANRGDDQVLAARGIEASPSGMQALRYAVQGTPEEDAPSQGSLSLDEKRKRRTQFMRRLYDETDGNRLQIVNYRDIGNAFGWSDKEAFAVAQYLEAEGLVEWHALGGGLGITHWGVREVEELEANPAEPTEHFAPITVINLQGDNYGQIQAGTRQSTQTQRQDSAPTESLLTFLNELRVALASPAEIPGKAMAEAALDAVEEELAEGRPDSPTVRRFIPVLRDFAIGLGSSGAYAGLVAAAQSLSS